MTTRRDSKVEAKLEELYSLGGPIFMPGAIGIFQALAVVLVQLEERLERLEGKK